MTETLQRRSEVLTAVDIGQIGRIATADVEYGYDQIGTEFAEALNNQYATTVYMTYSNGCVRSKTGESMAELTARDLRHAQTYSEQHPEHEFYVRRSQADYRRARQIDAELSSGAADGTVWLTVSTCPDEIADLYPEAVRQRHYRPDKQRSLWWLQRWNKTEQTIEMVSIAVDHKDTAQHVELFEQISGQELPKDTSAEDVPHYTARLALDDQEFSGLVDGISSWAKVEHRDALAEIDRYGRDLIDSTYWRHLAVDSAQTLHELQAEVQEIVSKLALQDERLLANNGINKHILEQALAGGQLGDNHRSAIKRAVLVSANATLRQRMNGKNSSEQKSDADNGAKFIENKEQMLGCAGGACELLDSSPDAAAKLRSMGYSGEFVTYPDSRCGSCGKTGDVHFVVGQNEFTACCLSCMKAKKL